jgi:hypothetical protein
LLGQTVVDGSWLARLQDDGSVSWCKRYSTTEGFDVMAPLAVFPTTAGFDIFLQTDPYVDHLAGVLRTNTTGAFQEAALYKLPVGRGGVLGVTRLADEGYVLASSTNLTGEYQHGNAHLLVLDTDLVPQLSTSIGSTDEHEYAITAVPTPDGGYLLGGGAAYEDLDDHRGGTAPRPYVAKTDAQGNYTCGDPIAVTMGDTTFTSIDRTLGVEAISGWVDAPITSMPWLVSVTVCGQVGVDETAPPVIGVGPNPASDQLVVLPTDQAVWQHALLDATGRLVHTHPRAVGRAYLDVRALAAGRYLLRSTSGTQVHSTAVHVVH